MGYFLFGCIVQDLFLGIIIGIIIARTMFRLLLFKQLQIIVENAIIDSIKLIGTSVHDIAFIRQLKYITLEEAGKTEEVKAAKNIHNYEFEKWRQRAVSNLQENCPAPYDRLYNLEDWQAVMQTLDQIYKAEIEKNK